MASHKYISKVRTKSGKWRYIYKDVGKNAEGSNSGDIWSKRWELSNENRKTNRDIARYYNAQSKLQVNKNAKLSGGSSIYDAHVRNNRNLTAEEKKMFRDAGRNSNPDRVDDLKYGNTNIGVALRRARTQRKRLNRLFKFFSSLGESTDSIKSGYDMYKKYVKR